MIAVKSGTIYLKKIILFLLPIVFSIISITGILDSFLEPSINSGDLQEKITSQGSFKRIDYIDSDGNLIIAADKGYATEIDELKDGHIIKKSYYDVCGNPIAAEFGQYAESKIWVDDKCVRVIFLDEEGKALINTSGFASKIQEYDNSNRLIAEFYLGIDNQPISNTRGEYGRAYEYNDIGLVSKIISLDENKQPELNLSGYCYILETYTSDGSLDTEMYYDINGIQVQLANGAYGVKHILNGTVFLNKEGKIKFNLIETFTSYPLVAIFIGLSLIFIMFHLPIRGKRFVTLLFSCFILYITLVSRNLSGGLNLRPFWSYRQFFVNIEMRVEILCNIWLFIPFGAGIYFGLKDKRYLVFPFFMSISIEIIQYFCKIGFCELDDVFSNTLGSCIGFMMAYEIEAIFLKRKIQ